MWLQLKAVRNIEVAIYRHRLLLRRLAREKSVSVHRNLDTTCGVQLLPHHRTCLLYKMRLTLYLTVNSLYLLLIISCCFRHNFFLTEWKSTKNGSKPNLINFLAIGRVSNPVSPIAFCWQNRFDQIRICTVFGALPMSIRRRSEKSIIIKVEKLRRWFFFGLRPDPITDNFFLQLLEIGNPEKATNGNCPYKDYRFFFNLCPSDRHSQEDKIESPDGRKVYWYCCRLRINSFHGSS